ncbi:28223_t:CDS:1, partial [Gigaspora margarita]
YTSINLAIKEFVLVDTHLLFKGASSSLNNPNLTPTVPLTLESRD